MITKVVMDVDGHSYDMSLEQTEDERFALNYVASTTIPGMLLTETEIMREYPVVFHVTYGDGNVQEFDGYSILVTARFIVIIDRTQADIDAVRRLQQKLLDGTASSAELSRFLLDSKGALNKSDFVRNWRNIHILTYMLGIPEIVEPPRPEIPNAQYYQDLIDAVNTVRSAKELYATTPETPDRPLNTYQKWNDLEKILWDCYERLAFIEAAYNYCGDAYYCGEGLGVIL